MAQRTAGVVRVKPPSEMLCYATVDQVVERIEAAHTRG